MNKKINKLLSIFLIILILATSVDVFALKDEFKLNVYNLDNKGNVKLEVITKGNARITISVKDSKKYHYFDQGITNSKGIVEFQTLLEEGKYNVKINVDGKVYDKEIEIKKSNVVAPPKEKGRKYKIRIEGLDKTILKTTEVEIKDSDLNLNKYDLSGEFDQEKPLHVLLKALDENTNINVKNKKEFNVGSGGYLTKIGDYEQGLKSGWMYCVNNKYSNEMINVHNIEEGDYLVFYFIEDWEVSSYSWFDKEDVVATVGENIKVKLKQSKYNSFENNYSEEYVKNADILINNISKGIKTDSNGVAELSFDKAGTYFISAEKFVDFNNEKVRSISRPYLKVRIKDKDDNLGEDMDNQNPDVEEKIDKTKLANKIDEINKMDLDIYTKKSRTELLNKVEYGKKLLLDKNVSQKDIDSILQEIIKLEKKLEEKIYFEDLSAVWWAEKSIYRLNDLGIVEGRETNKFEPFGKTTRAEFASMILRLFELDNETYTEKDYKDLKKDKWYYDNMQIALELGILKGYEDGTIKPDNFITREEIAKVISRVIKKEGIVLQNKNVLKEFKDEKNISYWAKDDIALLVENKIIKGYEDSTIQSKNEATRAETAVMIDRLIYLIEKLSKKK